MNQIFCNENLVKEESVNPLRASNQSGEIREFAEKGKKLKTDYIYLC